MKMSYPTNNFEQAQEGPHFVETFRHQGNTEMNYNDFSQPKSQNLNFDEGLLQSGYIPQKISEVNISALDPPASSY